MHTCAAPAAALDKWLTAYDSIIGNYGHLLLEQTGHAGAELIDELTPYFESAHLDAREYFHAEIGIDLHPDADDDGGHACYPNCLPATARRGLFGEVVAGLMTEHYQATFVGNHNWKIPIFLFRYHADVEAFLWDFARDEDRERQVFGRFGSDFIALAFDDQGAVVRYIAGEAKWRQKLQASVVDELMLGKWSKDPKAGTKVRDGCGIWFQVNRDTHVPHGLRQLQKLLKELDPEGHARAILSLDQALMAKNPNSLPRTNLILIAGNDVPSRDATHSLIPWQVTPKEYTAPHDLQVVELILEDGDSIIDTLYDRLWRAGDDLERVA